MRGPELAAKPRRFSITIRVGNRPGARAAGYRRSFGRPRKLGEGRAIGWRQLLDADQLGLGADDDRPRAGFVLRRRGEEEDRHRDDDAEPHSDGPGDRALGRSWLQPGVLRRLAVSGRPEVFVSEWGRCGAQSRLRRDDPAADVYGLSIDVRHHYPGADQRRWEARCPASI